MHLVYQFLFFVLWGGFLAYWRLMALNVKATHRLEPVDSRLARVAMFGTAIVLLGFQLPIGWLNQRIWPQNAMTFWIGAGVTLAGLAFSVWARVYLGRNWSSSVTIKQNHELIVSGPYGLVRHPIYTGLFLAFLGTILAVAEVRGLVAFVLIAISIGFKLRLEEKWMQSQFGAAYEDYSRRVSALVPHVL